MEVSFSLVSLLDFFFDFLFCFISFFFKKKKTIFFYKKNVSPPLPKNNVFFCLLFICPFSFFLVAFLFMLFFLVFFVLAFLFIFSEEAEGREAMENWEPLPKGFPQYNKSGSVRHVRELQGVMTS